MFEAWPQDLKPHQAFPCGVDAFLLIGRDLTGNTRYFKLQALDPVTDELTELTELSQDRDLFAAAPLADGLVLYSQDPIERDLYCRTFEAQP